jgi:hypothetical protein
LPVWDRREFCNPLVLNKGIVPAVPDFTVLKAVQSVVDKTPLFVADAVGKFKVIIGVVVGLATLPFTSVPVDPNDKLTFVTVPVPEIVPKLNLV